MSTTISPTASTGENVSEIQTLAQRVASLNQATDSWNNAMIAALVFTALAAMAVVGTTVMALKRAKEAGDAQAELIQAKDRQLALALGDRDVKIAQAGKDASDANRDAAKAKERASNNETAAAELRRDLIASEGKLAAAQVKLQQEQQKTAKAQKDAADAQREVNAVFAKRATTRQPERVVLDELKRYPPASAEILCRNEDPEAIFFAGMIRDLLRSSDWTIPEITLIAPARFNGSDLPLAGTSVRNNQITAWFPMNRPLRDPRILGEMLAAGEKSTIDPRLVFLLIGLKASPWKDETLQPGSFRIVVAGRDPNDLLQ